MIYLALASIAALALTVLAFAGLLRSERRQSAREREALLARIMHLAGRTWEEPPRPAAQTAPDSEPERFLVSPEYEREF